MLRRPQDERNGGATRILPLRLPPATMDHRVGRLGGVRLERSFLGHLVSSGLVGFWVMWVVALVPPVGSLSLLFLLYLVYHFYCAAFCQQVFIGSCYLFLPLSFFLTRLFLSLSVSSPP